MSLSCVWGGGFAPNLRCSDSSGISGLGQMVHVAVYIHLGLEAGIWETFGP